MPMKHPTFCLSISIFLILSLSIPSPIAADGGFFGHESVAVSVDQRAIIIKNGDQISMTFSTGYTGEGNDFAWIIPTPVPLAIEDVSEAGAVGEAAFELLQEYTAPVITIPARGGWGKAASKGPMSPVMVYGIITLEHYEVSILGAVAASPLLGWLRSNGYEVDLTAEKVLDAYIRENWFFVAIKLNLGEERHYDNEVLPPLTIKYRHNKLVFPLRISSISTTETVKITLYVITGSTVTPSNLPVETLEFEESIPEFVNYEMYVEECIRETTGREGRGLVVLWKGKYPATDELRETLNGLMKNPFPLDARTYLTRLEARMGASVMTEDIQIQVDPEPQEFTVGLTTSNPGYTPWKMPGISGVRRIAVSFGLFFLNWDGTVWRWSRDDNYKVVQVRGLSRVTAIVPGRAVKEDGTVWTMWDSRPVRVRGLSEVIAIATNPCGGHTVTLKKDGTVWTWGNNTFGELGDGTTTDRSTPVQVKGLSSVVAIAAGASHNVAVREDGSVWAWGSNNYGKLGDGTTMDRLTPVQVKGLTDVVFVAAATWGFHTFAVGEDGTVWAWGWNGDGQLGDGTITDRFTPVRISGLSQVVAITAGERHTLALREDGSVWAWGHNMYGQLGDSTTKYRFTPVWVRDLSGVVAIDTGQFSSAVVKEDGTVWAWGNIW